jgi:hypothetical protein
MQRSGLVAMSKSKTRLRSAAPSVLSTNVVQPLTELPPSPEDDPPDDEDDPPEDEDDPPEDEDDPPEDEDEAPSAPESALPPLLLLLDELSLEQA